MTQLSSTTYLVVRIFHREASDSIVTVRRLLSACSDSIVVACGFLEQCIHTGISICNKSHSAEDMRVSLHLAKDNTMQLIVRKVSV